MANNRMFLVYRPTGAAVHIGKRMGYGWYHDDSQTDLHMIVQRLFDHAEVEGAVLGASQDDFALVMEDFHDQPVNDGDWQYRVAGEDLGYELPVGVIAMEARNAMDPDWDCAHEPREDE